MISTDDVLEELLREMKKSPYEHRQSRIEKNQAWWGDYSLLQAISVKPNSIFARKQERTRDDWLDEWFPSEEVELDEPKKPKKKRKKRKKKAEDDIEDDDDDIIVGPTHLLRICLTPFMGPAENARWVHNL